MYTMMQVCRTLEDVYKRQVQPEIPAGQQIVRCSAGIAQDPQYCRQENEQGKACLLYTSRCV